VFEEERNNLSGIFLTKGLAMGENIATRGGKTRKEEK